MFVCIYAGERRDAAKFVRGDRGERVKHQSGFKFSFFDKYH